jgi:hypothetical protein
MYETTDQISDALDAAWDQAQQEERRQLEEMYLTNDPAYFEFLNTMQQENIHEPISHQG